MEVTSPTYLTAAETARLVRQALKKAFSNVIFSVRSKNYSGGASINVRWTDGPRTKEVQPIAQQYEGGGFDGMIDLKYTRTHFLRPDGSVYVRHDPGTLGSGGMVPSEDNRGLAPLMPAGVQAVRFGADFIFCERTISDFEAKKAQAIAWIYQHCHVVGDSGNPNVDMFGNNSVDRLATKMVYEYVEGDDWGAILMRI